MCATSVDNPKIDRAELGKAMEGSNLNDQICEKYIYIYKMQFYHNFQKYKIEVGVKN